MSLTQLLPAQSVVYKFDQKKSWQDISQEKLEFRDAQIPVAWRLDPEIINNFQGSDLRELIDSSTILDTLEKEITNITSVAILADRIATKHYSAEQVVTAFCKRAALAHQLTNCLTEIFFLEAISAARELDQGDTKGAFHGVPISLKDQFNVIGHDSSIGYVSGAGMPAIINSCLVESLVHQGGIMYCKTNVPQTVMTADTVNNLFGRTLNPVNKHIIPSGSSGGEAALVACRASILGIGTDTGGSIRNPSAACEIYGLKPSSGRLSYKNVLSSNDGNPCVISVAGPMATSLDSLEYSMASILATRPFKFDHDLVDLPWQPVKLDPSRLKIGIMIDHGDFPPHPCFSRILGNISRKLANLGVAIVSWESEELSILHQEIADVLAKTCLMDGGADIARHIAKSGEPLILPGLVDEKNCLTISELWKLNVKTRLLRNRYLELWQSAGLDAIICPTNTFAFLSEAQYAVKEAEIGYTGIFNLLDYSVVNWPAGPVIAEDLTLEQLGWNLQGFNVGCQVVTGRLQEEKAIAITRIIERATNIV